MVLAYRAGLPNALDGVSFTVYPGEKVGVVGRTGSGKSTLFLALFRMLELKAGRILLDGVDSRLVGLEELRYGGLSRAGGSPGGAGSRELSVVRCQKEERGGKGFLPLAASYELLCCYCRAVLKKPG